MRGTKGYDPLFKVKYPLEVIMKGMWLSWNAGKHVTINESMIRYMGRAVTYVQYMPAKPIKNGIKIFVFIVPFLLVFFRSKFMLARTTKTLET